MSTKAQEIRAKLKQRQEDAAVVTEVWHGLFPGWALGATQAMTWLVQGYEIDQIIVGLEAAHIQRSKRDSAVNEGSKGAKLMTAADAVTYASAVMRNVQFASLPEEQKEHLSRVRSEAGKRGAAARWNGKKDLPSVSTDLPAGCQTLPPSYSGSGSGSPSHSNSSSFSVSAAGAPEPRATPKAQDLEKGLEPEPKPEPQKPNSGLGAELGSKTRAKPETQKPEKPRLVKKGKQAGRPYPANFDSWARNSWRIDWLEGYRDDNGELLPITLEDEWGLETRPEPTPVPSPPPEPEAPADFEEKPKNLRKFACNDCRRWNGNHNQDCPQHPDNKAAVALEREIRERERAAKFAKNVGDSLQ